MEECCVACIQSFLPFCKSSGASCCSCNPRWCRNFFTCGFHEDDDRFASADKLVNGAPPAVGGPTGAAGGGTTTTTEEYGRSEMKAPGGV